MVANVHRNIATLAAIVASAVALAGMIFTAGDASQRLVSAGTAIVVTNTRIDNIEAKREAHEAAVDKRMTDLEVLVAHIDQATEDTRLTAHRIENTRNLKGDHFY